MTKIMSRATLNIISADTRSTYGAKMVRLQLSLHLGNDLAVPQRHNVTVVHYFLKHNSRIKLITCLLKEISTPQTNAFNDN